jgi:putative peptidoglycan lipid II flippase
MVTPTTKPTPPSPSSTEDHSSTLLPTKTGKALPSLFKAASLIAAVTLLSKLLGAIRDWQIMTLFGTGLGSDAYFSAVQLPSFALILLGGLGGPFHTATVSVFSRLLSHKTNGGDNTQPDRLPPSAQTLASTFITLTALVFSVLAGVTFVYARPIMAFILQHANPALINQAAHQLQILSPVVLLGGIIGIVYGLLNVFHQFFWPSFSPAILSLLMVVVLALSGPTVAVDTLAWSTLAGVCLMFACQLPALFKLKLPLKPSLNVQHPQLKGVLEMLFPAIIGTSMGQLNVYVDMFFTASLPLGGWTAIVMGNRLIQLPLGVLQTALLVPVFPRFTQLVAQSNWEGLQQTFRLAVVSLWLVSMPILVFLLWYCEPLIKLFFQHGQFDARATHMVATVVVALAASIPAYFTRDTLTRVFYAFADAKTPLFVGALAIVTNAVLDAVLVKPLGVAGIALSTSLVTTINMGLLMVLAQRFKHPLGLKALLLPFGQIVLCSALMAIVIAGLSGTVSPWLLGYLPNNRLGLMANMLLIGGLGTVCYGVGIMACRLPEATMVINRLLRRKPVA